MLKGIDPLLSPALLEVLAAMGHGDEIAVVDANYPAVSTSRRLVRVDGANLAQACSAILSVLPLDTFIERPIAAMQMVDTPETTPDVQVEIFAIADRMEQRSVGFEKVERFAFYERVRNAFAVVSTAELRPYGCVVFTKGVIFGS